MKDVRNWVVVFGVSEPCAQVKVPKGFFELPKPHPEAPIGIAPPEESRTTPSAPPLEESITTPSAPPPEENSEDEYEVEGLSGK